MLRGVYPERSEWAQHDSQDSGQGSPSPLTGEVFSPNVWDIRPPMTRQPEASGPSTPSRLRVVFGDRVGEVSGVLHHWLDLWPGQKARTQRLILDALRQPLDARRCLPKGSSRLCRLATCLIQRSQRRLDLPAFSWQADACRQPCSPPYMATTPFPLSLPPCNHRPHP